jgi:hypothetical protein
MVAEELNGLVDNIIQAFLQKHAAIKRGNDHRYLG